MRILSLLESFALFLCFVNLRGYILKGDTTICVCIYIYIYIYVF